MKDNSLIESNLSFRKQLFNITQANKAITFDWTIEEDMKLIELFHQNKSQWTKISTNFNSKDARQCCYRNKTLTSQFFQRKFNRRDDITLISLVDKYGNNWEKIESEMPGYIQKGLRERYELSILPKRLSYLSQEEERYKNDNYQLTSKTNKVHEPLCSSIINQSNNTTISINSTNSITESLPISELFPLTNNNISIDQSNDVISSQQFVNKNCLSLFTKYHQRLVVLSNLITKEYRYYARTINKPEIKKLKMFLKIINSEIKASFSLLTKMKNNSINFFENSLILMNKKYKIIKISQLLLKFFRRLVKEI